MAKKQRAFIPAALGGPCSVHGLFNKFCTISQKELYAVELQLGSNHPLSGYLGGVHSGGYWVENLESKWCEIFGCKYAVAVNSATSGLLCAAASIDLKAGEEFICTPFTMSATAAAPAILGAKPVFCDIESLHFCLDPGKWCDMDSSQSVKAVILTNLFGHPGGLAISRKKADSLGIFLIEDNAQAPFAMEGEKFAGTIGHIGVFSLNVHKHIQCGEGGICVTDDQALYQRMREFRNHGEMFENGRIGLNLRMTETTAAIAACQLGRAKQIITNRIEQANFFVKSLEDIPGIIPPTVRETCKHVWYAIPIRYDEKLIGISRQRFMNYLHREFVNYLDKPNPIQQGYVQPLYHLPAFKDRPHLCPVAEDAYHKSLIYFENCTYTLTLQQMGQIGRAFAKIAYAGMDGDFDVDTERATDIGRDSVGASAEQQELDGYS